MPENYRRKINHGPVDTCSIADSEMSMDVIKPRKPRRRDSESDEDMPLSKYREVKVGRKIKIRLPLVACAPNSFLELQNGALQNHSLDDTSGFVMLVHTFSPLYRPPILPCPPVLSPPFHTYSVLDIFMNYGLTASREASQVEYDSREAPVSGTSQTSPGRYLSPGRRLR